MIVKTLLAALVAGLFVGVLMTPVQYAGVVPLILHAEEYEQAGGHEHASLRPDRGFAIVSQAEAHSGASADGEDAESNASLFKSRMLGTLLANLVAGGGFALVLVGMALLVGRSITSANGVYWGLAGFATIALAPALGLPPELPAMPAADLFDRQIWWAMTVVLTAAAIWLFVFRREAWAKVAGVVLLVVPHLVGAPHPADLTSAVPPTLAAEFAVASLVTGAIFWVLLGLGVGTAMDRLVAGRHSARLA